MKQYLLHILLLTLFSSCAHKFDAEHELATIKKEAEARSGTDFSFCDGLQCLDSTKAVQIALYNNQKLKASYQMLSIADANRMQAALLENPIFSLALRADERAVFEWSITQSILSILLQPPRKKLAQKEYEIIEKEILQTILQTILDTKMAFYELQTTLSTFLNQKKITELRKLQYEMMQKLVEAGNTIDLFLQQSKNNYFLSLETALETQNRLCEKKEILQRLLQLPESMHNWKISQNEAEIQEENLPLDQIEKMALTQNIGLQQKEKEMQKVATKTGIDITQVLFAELSAGISGENNSFGPQIMLSLPFFDDGKAKKLLGDSMLLKLYHEYWHERITLISRIRQEHFAYKTWQKKYTLYENSLIENSKVITEQTLLQVNAMQMSVFTLLDAKISELEVTKRLIEAKNQYRMSQLRLEAFLQGLTPMYEGI